jgi:hypothetical protein
MNRIKNTWIIIYIQLQIKIVDRIEWNSAMFDDEASA